MQRHLWSGLLAVALLGILAPGCGDDGDGPSAASHALSVVTTAYPLEYFAQRVGGAEVAVTNLVAPGVEAHTFEPTAADIRRLDGADVVLYNGSGFEPWMGRALAATNGGRRTVIEASRDEEDPHLWLDPLRAIEQVERVRDGLSDADPTGAGAYGVGATSLIAELRTLDQAFIQGLSGCGQDHFVTSHAAFGHLAQRYGLVQVPISGLSPEAETGPGDLASIVETIDGLGVEYVMVEPVISTRFAQTVAGEVGASLLTLHPLASLTPDESERGEDYFSLMEANLESLSLALECGP